MKRYDPAFILPNVPDVTTTETIDDVVLVSDGTRWNEEDPWGVMHGGTAGQLSSQTMAVVNTWTAVTNTQVAFTKRSGTTDLFAQGTISLRVDTTPSDVEVGVGFDGAAPTVTLGRLRLGSANQHITIGFSGVAATGIATGARTADVYVRQSAGTVTFAGANTLAWSLIEQRSTDRPIVEVTALRLSGIDGAGFQNTIAAHPSNGVVLSGADTGGIARSTDSGRTFVPANQGMWKRQHHQTAGLVWCTEYPDIVFAAVGSSGTAGGFAWSTDQGVTWNIKDGSQPMFAANLGSSWASGSLPSDQPRSTGRLIAWWTDTNDEGYVWAASAKTGVWRAPFDPTNPDPAQVVGTFTRTGGTGVDNNKLLRGLAVSSDGATLLVSVFGDSDVAAPGRWDSDGRVWRIDNANNATAPTVAIQESNSPRTPEDLLWLGSYVYCAASGAPPGPKTDQGIWRRTATNTWTQIDSGLPGSATTVEWKSLAGYVSGSDHVLFAGTNVSDDPNPDDTGLVRSDDANNTGSAPTWFSLSGFAANDRQYTLGDLDGPVWWATEGSYTLRWTYPYDNFACSDLEFDATNNALYMSGRSGSFRSDDPLQTSPDGTSLFPINRGLNVTYNNKTVCHPTTAKKVLEATTDWVNLTSTSGFATVSLQRPSAMAANSPAGFDAAWDATAAEWILCVGHRDDSDANGELYTSPDPWTTAWTKDTTWNTDVGRRPISIAVGYEGSTRYAIVCAAGSSGSDGGIYQKVGSGTWTRRPVSGGATFKNAIESNVVQGPIAWADQGTATDQAIYVLDREQSTIYRSTDTGDSFHELASGLGITSTEQYGWIACPPTDPTTLYIQTNSKVYRLDSADTVSAPITFPDDCTDITPPQPNSESINGLAIDPSNPLRIWVGMHATSASNLAKLMLTEDGGTTWTDRADDIWRAKVQDMVMHLACDQGGHVYAAIRGNGVVIGDRTVA